MDLNNGPYSQGEEVYLRSCGEWKLGYSEMFGTCGRIAGKIPEDGVYRSDKEWKSKLALWG